MKFRSFLLAAAAMLFAVACNETPEEPVNPEAQVAVMPMEVSYVANGGENAVSVVAKGAWTATPSADWITVSPASGEAGTVSVKVTAAVNEVLEAREGVVTFTVGTDKAELKVKQAAGEAGGDELWGLVGDFKDETKPSWNPKEPIALTWDGAYYSIKNFAFNEGASFKFVENGPVTEWANNRGYSGDKPMTANYYYALTANGGNINISVAGNYDVYLSKDSKTFYLMEAGKLPAEAQDSETIEVAPFVPEGLFLVGNATDFGWDNTGADEGAWMTRGRNGSFTWTGNLYAGEDKLFKFLYEPGNWDARYLRDAEAEEYWTLKHQPNGGSDDQFSVEEDGVYTIELNVLDLTISCVKQDAPAVTTWDLAALGLTSYKGTNSAGVYEFDSYNEDESLYFWLKLAPADGVLATEEGVWYDGNQDSEERSVFGTIDDSTTFEWAYIVAGSMCLSTTDVEGVYEMLIPEGDPLIFEGSYGKYSVSGTYTVNMTVDTKLEFWVNPDAGLGGQIVQCQSLIEMGMGLPGHQLVMTTDNGDFAMVTLLDMTNVDGYKYPTSGLYVPTMQPDGTGKYVVVGMEQFGYFRIGGTMYMAVMPESPTDANGNEYGVIVQNGLDNGMNYFSLSFNLPVMTMDNTLTVLTGEYQGMVPEGFGAAAKPEVELNLEGFGFTNFTAVLEGNMAVLTSRSMNGSLMLNITNWGEPFASEDGELYIANEEGGILNGMLIIDDGFDYLECPLKMDGGRMMLFTTETPHVYEAVFSSHAPMTFEGASRDYKLGTSIDTYEITIEGLMSAPAGEGDEITEVINMCYPEMPESMIYFKYADKLVQLDCFNKTSSENTGIVEATYPIAEFADFDSKYYIAAGNDAIEGMDYGSYIYAADMSEKFGNIISGSMDAKNNGDGTWTLTFDLTCDTGLTFQGEYTGEILVQ